MYYVALQLPVWSKSLYLGEEIYLVQFFSPCPSTNFQTMDHPTLVFRPAHNEFLTICHPTLVPVYSCVYPTTCIW